MHLGHNFVLCEYRFDGILTSFIWSDIQYYSVQNISNCHFSFSFMLLVIWNSVFHLQTFKFLRFPFYIDVLINITVIKEYYLYIFSPFNFIEHSLWPNIRPVLVNVIYASMLLKRMFICSHWLWFSINVRSSFFVLISPPWFMKVIERNILSILLFICICEFHFYFRKLEFCVLFWGYDFSCIKKGILLIDSIITKFIF